MSSPKLSVSRPALKKEEEELIFNCVNLLKRKITSNEYSKEQVDELEGIVQSVKSVFHLSGLRVTDNAQISAVTKKADLLRKEGNQLYAEHKYEAAIEKYTQAIELDPSPAYFSNRGTANFKLEEYDKSIRDCQKAVSLDKEYAKAHHRLGMALEQKNRFAEAVEALKTAVELESNNSEWKSNLFNVINKFQQDNLKYFPNVKNQTSEVNTDEFEKFDMDQMSELEFDFDKFKLSDNNGNIKNQGALKNEASKPGSSISESTKLDKNNEKRDQELNSQEKSSTSGTPPWWKNNNDLPREVNEPTIGSTKTPHEDLLNSVSVPSSIKDIKNQKSNNNGKVGSNSSSILTDEKQFLLEHCEITPVNRASSFSESGDLKYIVDAITVKNFEEVAPIKHAIAERVEPVPERHLLNLWKFKQFPYFPELILLYQYIYEFTLTETFNLDDYQRILDIVIEHEKIFTSCIHFAREVELMLELRFLYIPDSSDERQIAINKELRNLTMTPLARGMPSMLMYALMKTSNNQIRVGEFKKCFSCKMDVFISYLLETLNQRPDLFILEKSCDYDIYLMNIILNPRICRDFIVYDYELRDLRMSEALHLRRDCIDSISQFTH